MQVSCAVVGNYARKNRTKREACDRESGRFRRQPARRSARRVACLQSQGRNDLPREHPGRSAIHRKTPELISKTVALLYRPSP
jgi:hypothetical protein